ncbi:MAG TPA: thiamine pyrophosphate-dependent enzyme, partial [Patescibacteria group bacterium]|nr:thiamine pyrophosphate-dependent enzyme [Patescibacteria group bacterium]
SVGGTLHVIVNNLIGFTTEPSRLHSSRYASDVARRLSIPIIHVNGEDPEAVQRAGRLALEYRVAFRSDVVIDLIGYRRYGHSEVDDPTTTQPRLYREIEKLPMLWQSYAGRIGTSPAQLAALEQRVDERLAFEQEAGRALKKTPVMRTLPPYWEPFVGGAWSRSLEVPTGVPRERLEQVARRLTDVPEGFTVHPKVLKGIAQRLEMGLGARPVDWGMAEALAFGTLLWEGTPVRLSGQDTRRGTFNQRHAVWIDHETGAEHAPLGCLREGQARFDVLDTQLSEASCLGFEYGFSRDYPEALVCWEAQFGDFANGAQVIIDQFISAGEDKWGLLSGLTLLLPHGYEGQGPEHSSARVERYLQLAAEDNIQVCCPSTAAQYFHLLRRQALRSWRKPLVVLTPKGMLRSPAACSGIEEMCGGGFRGVLPESELDEAACLTVERALVCAGRISHELRRERHRREAVGSAVIALEQIHPFPVVDLESALERHPAAREIVWVQEEPANMGALSFVRPLLQRAAGGRQVRTVKRSPSASPATGSAKAHALEQQALIELALAAPTT